MATNFPGSIDNSTSLPYPSSGNFTNGPSLAGGQDNQNDAIIATQTKVGSGSSTPSGTNLLVSTGTGTSAWTKVAPAGTIVGTTDSQTLTNKTLTSPTINSPIISNASITADSIVGFTTANSGSVYGVVVATGAITGANSVNGSALVSGTVPASAIVASSLTATQLANGAVTPSKLATGAAYALVATSQGTASAAYTDLATVGPTVTATIGANGLALVILAVDAQQSAANYSFMSFAMSGANTRAAAAPYELFVQFVTAALEQKPTYTVLLTGLTPGSTTFTSKYKVTGGTGTFVNREITVVPL